MGAGLARERGDVSLNDLKEAFSHAYVRAVAHAAGYFVQEASRHLDADGVPAPGEVAAYLLQQGWTLQRSDVRWAEYAKTIEAEPVVLEVPQQAGARDYARTLGFLIEDIARLESRTPSAVLRDLKASSVDIVRLAIDSAMTRDGRIPVEAGHRVYEAARDLLLSAACSAIDPRPAFARRKPEEAMALLQRARCGQTELGSFVLTIERTIAPRLQQTLLTDDGDPDAPLERRAYIRLAHALEGAEAASRESAASGRIEPFRRRAPDGVSANLCDAMAEMLDATAADAVRASFSFASRRPPGGSCTAGRRVHVRRRRAAT
jgi:hypothetical protein